MALSSRVCPATADKLGLPPLEWSRKMIEVTNFVKENNRIPYAKKLHNRVGSVICGVFCCSPCCLWSTAWRLAACPFMCLFKGPMYACGNNGCTAISDKCIEVYADEVYKYYTMPQLSKANPESMTVEEARAVHEALKTVLAFFMDVPAGSYNEPLTGAPKMTLLSKRRAQNQFMDYCFRPIFDFAGGSRTFGRYDTQFSSSACLILQAAMDKIASKASLTTIGNKI